MSYTLRRGSPRLKEHIMWASLERDETGAENFLHNIYIKSCYVAELIVCLHCTNCVELVNYKLLEISDSCISPKKK